MIEKIKTEVCGLELALVISDFRRDGEPDLWKPVDWNWGGPTDAKPIHEWPEIIKKQQVAAQVEAGFEVWDLNDDRPKYWHKRPAVFRSGGNDPRGHATKQVETRNGTDPKNLYAIPLRDCAPITPEVEAAIAEARRLHAEALEAGKRWREAWAAIPRLSDEDWASLPQSPRDAQ